MSPPRFENSAAAGRNRHAEAIEDLFIGRRKNLVKPDGRNHRARGEVVL